MWSRRAFIVAFCGIATCRVTEVIALDFKKSVLEWFEQALIVALPSLNEALDYALRFVTDWKILTDIRARVADVRRRLTDSTPEHHLHVKLTEWLDRYDQWVSEKAKPGESDADFAARHEHERILLQANRHSCQLDAVAALEEIRYLGDELHSIDSNAMTSEEWHYYNHLLDDEKMVVEAINMDMPTEPIFIEVLRGVAKRLENIVGVIDKRTGELDKKIKANTP
jgi:hypothetical protein